MRKLGLLLLVLAGALFAGVAHAAAAELRVDDDHVQVTIGACKNNLKILSDKPLQAVVKAPPTMTEPGDIVRINTARTSSSGGSRSRARCPTRSSAQ